MEKNFRIFGVRSGLIGDSIMALPILNYLEKLYPNSYKYWFLDKKCSQSLQCYVNHPQIDKILISQANEGVSQGEIGILQNCNLILDTSPNHPDGDACWPNYRNIFEETWVMAGIPLKEYYNLHPNERRPKLERWFDVVKYTKTVAIFPFAGYGREPKRSPTLEWYKNLVNQLELLGYTVFQFGHQTEPSICEKRFNELPFFEQIKMAVGCDLTIGTDSGTALIMGAYEVPQISLLSRHWPGHIENPLAFSTNNPNNQSLFSDDGNANSIQIENVISAIKSI